MIEVVPPKELGSKYPATIFHCGPVEGDYGPQILFKMVEPNGNVERRYLPVPAKESTRTGRILKSLLGKYPTDTVDESVFVGMTVDMIYAPNARDASKMVLDMLVPRTAAKGENTKQIVEQALLFEDKDAPF